MQHHRTPISVAAQHKISVDDSYQYSKFDKNDVEAKIFCSRSGTGNLEVDEIEVDKTCFEVESKVNCIPRVVFPWQKAKKYKCPACKYTWTAEKKDTCAGCCDLGCADMSGIGMPSVPGDTVPAPVEASVDAAPETWMTEEGYTATLIEPNAAADTGASGLESVQVESADAMPPAPKAE